jgi:hypothetical protein
VLAGVTPFGVVVDVPLLFAHPGIRMKAPPSTKRLSTPQALLERFPPAAAPKAMIPSNGNEIQRPKRPRELWAPVVTGPNVLMVRVALVAVVPFTFRLVDPSG